MRQLDILMSIFCLVNFEGKLQPPPTNDENAEISRLRVLKGIFVTRNRPIFSCKDNIHSRDFLLLVGYVQNF